MVADSIFSRIDAQDVIFSPSPDRVSLLSITPDWPMSDLSVRVHRNLAAEHLLSITEPFANYAGYRLVPTYSAYDDGLSLAALDPAQAPDVELVCLDYSRYKLDGCELGAHIADRVRALRALSSAPIIVIDAPPEDERAGEVGVALQTEAERTPSVLIARHHDAFPDGPSKLLSDRALALTGVPYSPQALLGLGRQLGLAWLPAAQGRRVRAVAFDLDGTLYAGVLGEDGVAGLRIDEGFRALQAEIARLRKEGIFVAIVSKNDPADAAALFESGVLGVKATDVDAWAVGWQAKDESIKDVAAQLRIAPATFLFVDDNPGELLRVASAWPGISVLHAKDPVVTRAALASYPGLFRFADAGADKLRVADLASESERAALRQEQGADVFLSNLEVKLSFGLNPHRQRARLAELSAKTNQFCTALRRLNEGEIAERLEEPEACVVSVALTDRLSDSGVIAFLSARKTGDVVIVEDICVSCRALGRGVEELMLNEALRRVMAELGAASVAVEWQEGPRNQPALKWLSSAAGLPLERSPAPVVVPGPEPVPVTIEWSEG